MAQSLAEHVLDQTTDRVVSGGRETPRTAPLARRPSEAEALPRPFGRYELRSLLGRGAMGAVYLAHDPQLDRLVALKIPRPLDEDPTVWRDRFLSEARAAATLHHPNICPVFEVGQVDEHPYLTMAYIEGETLAARLRRAGALPIADAVEIVRTICRAMAEAHERGIVHRDLKPANIMLDRRGQPVIMDFGLALRATASDDLRLTLSGVAMGTPCYMPPEQAGGDHDAIGPPADVYALGVILYELATGQVPFQARTFGKLLAQIERDDPTPPQAVNPAIDERLEIIILRALAKDPADRFASAAELADALDAYAAGAPLPAGCTPPKRLAETAQWPAARPAQAGSRGSRRPAIVAVAGALVAVALGIFIYVRTDYGDLAVTLNDPTADVKITVNGQEVILDPDGDPIRVRAGARQQLVVEGKDFLTESRTFDLKRGGKAVVHLELKPKQTPGTPVEGTAGEQQVVKAPLPPPKPVAYPAEPTLIEFPGWQILTDATASQTQTWIDERKAAKHSVMWLDVVAVAEQPVFAGIAALDERASDWKAFIDLTSAQANDVGALVKRFDPTSYVAKSITGYVQGENLTGVAVYHPGYKEAMAGVPLMHTARQNIRDALANSYVVRAVRPFTTSNGTLLCGLYVEGALNSKSRHGLDLSEAALERLLEQNRQDGAYPTGVAPYLVNGTRLFAVAFREDPTKAPWELVRDLTADQLKSQAPELATKGMYPVSINVDAHDGAVRYFVVWRKETPKEPEPSP